MSEQEFQEKMMMKLTGIENCLLGTEYDRDNGGGLVKRVNKNTADIKCISEETRTARWFQRNPGKTIAVAVMFLAFLFMAFHVIDLRATLKNKTGIELRDGS